MPECNSEQHSNTEVTAYRALEWWVRHHGFYPLDAHEADIAFKRLMENPEAAAEYEELVNGQ